MPGKVAFLGLPGGLGMGLRTGMIQRKLSSLLDVEAFSYGGKLEAIRALVRHPSLVLNTSLELIRLRTLRVIFVEKLERIRERVAVVHAETTPMGYAAMKFSEQSGVPYVLDLHGLWASELRGEPHLHSDSEIALVSSIEADVVRHASHIIVVSNRMRDHVISEYRVAPGKVTVIPNGGIVTSRRATFRLPFTLVFGGMFNYYERPEDFVALARTMEDPSFRFWMLGYGPRKRAVLREERKAPRQNFHYLGSASREVALNLFATCQAGVAPSTSDVARQVAWPIKVMDYMSVGLPVIAPEVGDWAKMIRDSDAGIVTKASGAVEFMEAAKQLRDREKWSRLSYNAVAAVRQTYSWDLVLEPIEGVYADYR